MDTAKIFWSGRSQAVRLPKEYRFTSSEVRIRRQGNAVVLEPIQKDWAWLDALVGKVDDVKEDPGTPERPEIDDYFK
jgi:antitoxin VapB